MRNIISEQLTPAQLAIQKWKEISPAEFILKSKKATHEYIENKIPGTTTKKFYIRERSATPPVVPPPVVPPPVVPPPVVPPPVVPPPVVPPVDPTDPVKKPPFSTSGCIDVTTTGEDIINKGALVKRCQKGKIVEKIQERLKEHGYLDFSIDKKIDGIYGSRTEAMVDDFQKDHLDVDGVQLVDDGIVGKKTWLALNQTPSDKPENKKNTTAEKGKVTTDDKTKTTVDKAKTKLPDEDDLDDIFPVDVTSTDDENW